jgi:manganese efflux pump family protein
MEQAALLAWVATALGGSALFLQWLRHRGLKQREGIRAPRLFSHAGLAVLGLAFWIGFIVSDERALAWVAVALLIVVAVLGVTMFAIWLRGHNERQHTVVPAETSFPIPIVFGHGVLALTTLVLAVLAASGVGT